MKHRKHYFPRHCGTAMNITMNKGDGQAMVKAILTCRECGFKMSG